MEQNNFSIEIFGSVPLEETIYRACRKQRDDSVAEKKRIEDTVQQLHIHFSMPAIGASPCPSNPKGGSCSIARIATVRT